MFLWGVYCALDRVMSPGAINVWCERKKLIQFYSIYYKAVSLIAHYDICYENIQNRNDAVVCSVQSALWLVQTPTSGAGPGPVTHRCHHFSPTDDPSPYQPRSPSVLILRPEELCGRRAGAGSSSLLLTSVSWTYRGITGLNIRRGVRSFCVCRCSVYICCPHLTVIQQEAGNIMFDRVMPAGL